MRAQKKSWQEIADALELTREGARYLVNGDKPYDSNREHEKYLRRKQRGYYTKQ